MFPTDFQKEEKKFWEKTIIHLKQEKNDFYYAIKIINKYDCIKDTIKRASHFANVAIDSLGSFKDNKYKKALINLIQSSLNRLN